MQLVDTHCHIHFPDYQLDPETVRTDAAADGVTKLMLVGCTLEDSQLAIRFADSHDNCWATIGLHPHEGSVYANDKMALATFAALAKEPKVVAIGETGLDFHYDHSPREQQFSLLEFQLQLAQDNNLPLVLHIRDAFEDFWPVFDRFKGLRAVVHSFSAHQKQLDAALSRGLYIGLNGIMTFTKDNEQLDAARNVPLNRLLLETDAPFLTPSPYRGRICEPKHVRVTAEFLANLRGESLEQLASATTKNATTLFKIRESNGL